MTWEGVKMTHPYTYVIYSHNRYLCLYLLLNASVPDAQREEGVTMTHLDTCVHVIWTEAYDILHHSILYYIILYHTILLLYFCCEIITITILELLFIGITLFLLTCTGITSHNCFPL